MKQACKIFLTAFIGMILFSCVKEDRSDCPPIAPQTLIVELSMAPDGADVTPTPEDLKLAVVYLFDASGTLFASWAKQNPILNTPYDTGIVPGDRDYRMIVWINPVEPYSITPAYTTRSDLSDGRIELVIPPDGNMPDLIPMLLYGSMNQISTQQTDTALDVPISFNTHRISMTVKNFPPDETYTLRVSDNSSGFDFNNQSIPAPEFTYLSEIPAPDESGNSAVILRMLQLDDDRSPQLSIVDSSGDTVFPANGAPSVNLMDLLDQAGIDPDTTRILDIEVEQHGVSSTTIYINGWKVVLEGYDIINE